MKSEEYQERNVEVGGWPVHLASYRIGEEWHCHADNVSPGANIARTTGSTREEAEQKALKLAGDRLAQTKRHTV